MRIQNCNGYLSKIIVSLFILWNLAEFSYGFSYVAVTPEILRADTTNKIILSSKSVGRNEHVDLLISYENLKIRKRIHFYTNGLHVEEFTIPSKILNTNNVMVNFEIKHGFTSRSWKVAITKNNGYIFIQTDKPIYTPREKVKYRIIGVDEDQSTSNKNVIVDIISPHGIILDRMTYKAHDAFNKKEFKLPKESELGLWKIKAFFEDDSSSKEVEFEVEEYVLPTFKVMAESSNSIIMESSRFFKINVNATYVYGKPVTGDCTMRLGVVQSGQVALFNKTYQQKLKKGKTSFVIMINELKKSPLWFPKQGSPLYIETNVTEVETGIVESAVDLSAIFANSYYELDFTSSKKNFKPGKPYMLEIDVKDTSGRLVPGLHLAIKTKIDRVTGEENTIKKTNENGHIDLLINGIPGNSRTIKFTVSEVISLDPLLEKQETFQFEVKKTITNSLSLANNIRSQVNEGMKVNINYNYMNDKDLTVIVAAKGRIVFVDSLKPNPSGTSVFTIPDKYKSDLAPIARMIVYYHNDENVQAESITMKFPANCIEELSLHHTVHGLTSLPVSPKKSARLKVKGGAHMRVGLLAVDQAVYFLNDEIFLSRESLFDQLNKHDNKPEVSQHNHANGIFEDNGLKYTVISPPKRNFGGFGPRFELPGMGFQDYNIMQRKVVSYQKNVVSAPPYETVPAQKVRKYFPESWLFEDRTLSRRGRHTEKIVLPDSITTWIVHAVGISANRGVCVAKPIEFVSTMPFFVQLHLPYKAVRLEQVQARVTLYNYKGSNARVKLNITTDSGVCLPKCRRNCNALEIQRGLNVNDVKSNTFDIIPLITGDLTIRIQVIDDSSFKNEVIDVIEKKLYVVPEGKRLRKTMTFALDPHGQLLSSYPNHHYKPKDELVVIDLTNNVQTNEVDLALPVEIIPGTGTCGIQASGDLMGDVITSALIGDGNIFVSSFYDAEEVVGNLAPTVHALQYLNSSGLLKEDTLERMKQYVIQGIVKLQRYRHLKGAYSLMEKSSPVTGFTASVLKTLCHVQHLTFVDQKLLDSGFLWILDQVDDDGRPIDNEPDDNEMTIEHDVVLASEILIAKKECNLSELIHHQELEIKMIMFIEEHIEDISNPLVLAKMAYALQLAESPEVNMAVDKLVQSAKKSKDHTYWTEEEKENGTPYWYQQGPDAFSIETTAYALLVYMRLKHLDPHPLADWLIRQRNSKGGFVTPIDTAIAIQALSEFSALKHSSNTDLHLEISSKSSVEYNHILAFNKENAIQQKRVPDVPIGDKINIKTNGTGLGQMQIKVGYNIPTSPNDNCLYDVTVERNRAAFQWKKSPDEISLCRYCNYGCTQKDDKSEAINILTTGIKHVRNNKQSLAVNLLTSAIRNARQRRALSWQFRRRRLQNKRRGTKKRSTISKLSLCLQVCVKYRGKGKSGPTNVEIEMLSGYQPIQEDLDMLVKLSNGRVKSYRNGRESLTIYLNEVPNNESICLHVRVKEDEYVGYLQSAAVVVSAPSKPEAICLQNYNSGDHSVTLPMFCINQNRKFKGECTCISGLCGTCPSKYKHVGSHELKEKMCSSDVVYDMGVQKIEKGLTSKDMMANIQETHIKGAHDVKEGQQIQFTTPLACPCPNFDQGQSVIIIGKNPIRFMSRENKEMYRYMIDETTTFVNVTERGGRGAVRELTFNRALNTYQQLCQP